jgi:hypothetical protein
MTNLNLIPGSGKEFRDKEYWDKFFKIRGSKAFEWYGEYENLCDVIHRYIKIEDKILMIGCGNSKLSESMYDVGLRHVTNIDLSEVVINQMSLKNRSRTGMTFLKMDMLNMEFDDASFDVVVDKGTLDALMSDYSEKVRPPWSHPIFEFFIFISNWFRLLKTVIGCSTSWIVCSR